MGDVRRLLVDEEAGTVELPVLVLSGLIEPSARLALRDRHVRLDRSVGAYQLIGNARLFGVRGSCSYQELRSRYADVADHVWEPVGPVVERDAYTYALLVPRTAVSGFFVERWIPIC